MDGYQEIPLVRKVDSEMVNRNYLRVKEEIRNLILNILPFKNLI